MRFSPTPAALRGVAIVTCAGALLIGCSSADDGGESPAGPADTAEPTAPAAPADSAAGATAVSPGGVTTSVDAPADATESEYGQSCHAAKLWMDSQQVAAADPTSLVEPYLEILQAPDFADPGNFNTPWVQLTPAQQAAVIMAVNGAANGECE